MKNKKSTRSLLLVALANGFVTRNNLAGGDRLLIGLAAALHKKISITIILPRFARSHWKKKGTITFKTLTSHWFDEREKKVMVLIAYFLRIIPTIRLLNRLHTSTPTAITIYSSSDTLADVIPAWWLRRYSRVIYLAQLYHMVTPPGQRNGPYLQNLAAFFLQRLSIWLIKRRADVILVDNENTRQFLLKKHVSADRIAYFGGAADIGKLTHFKPQPVDISDVVIVSRLDPTKNLMAALDLWRTVISHIPTAQLSLIGSSTPQQITAVKRQIINYHLTQNTKLHGYISHTTTPGLFDYVKRARVFWYMEKEGGRSLALIEALACGLPVVSRSSLPKAAGIYNGVIFCKSNTQVIQQTVRLLKDDIYYHKLHQAALQQARNFSFSDAGKKFVKIMRIAQTKMTIDYDRSKK